MSVTLSIDGDLSVAHDLEMKAAKVGAEAFGVTRKWGMILQSRIQARAQGRPGPRRRTGDYLRSWSTITTSSFAGPRSEVGTNAPQARRLEHGFVGTDAIGRRYNQPPYPHVRPALDTVEPEFLAALAMIVFDGM